MSGSTGTSWTGARQLPRIARLPAGTAGGTAGGMLAVALVLARVLAQGDAPAPVLSDEAILVLKRHDLRVGNGCTTTGGGDAGVADGSTPDAELPDAGVDAGVADAGADDACEHIPGDAITIVVQPRFSQLTTGARFAILMVTPARPIVEVTSGAVFPSLDAATAPAIHEVTKEVEDPAYGTVCATSEVGCGGGPILPDDPYWEPPVLGDGGLGLPDGDYSVDRVGAYEVLRGAPSSTTELTTWLTDLGYLVMPDDVAAVSPYLAKGYTVVAVRVALDDTPEGLLAPIALTWPGSELRLPAALGSSSAAFPTTIYIAADHRYDFIGAEVSFAFRVNYDETSFLTKNEVAFVPRDPDEDPVAIQIASDPEKREIIERITEVHVPVRDRDACGCHGAGRERDGGGCGECSARGGPRPDWGVLLGAIVFTLIPRRRARAAKQRGRAPGAMPGR